MKNELLGQEKDKFYFPENIQTDTTHFELMETDVSAVDSIRGMLKDIPDIDLKAERLKKYD